MVPTDRFSTDEVQRILGLTGKQLDYWDRLRLVSPKKDLGDRSYDFRDLIGLRTVKQLIEKGVPANRLRRALSALNEKLSQAQAPLAELRVLSDGRDIIVQRGEARLEPLSGQFVLNFETRELDEQVRVMATRSADDWFQAALQHEADAQGRAKAADAYEQAICADPRKVEALINYGTLHYEDGEFAKAADYFKRAVDCRPDNPLAHYNLGSALEEMGQLEKSREHLRRAVELDPAYADAHYNLALLCDKMLELAEAREHWQAYVKLDPAGPSNNYARQRIAATDTVKMFKRK